MSVEQVVNTETSRPFSKKRDFYCAFVRNKSLYFYCADYIEKENKKWF